MREINELDTVETVMDLKAEGNILPAGSKGVVVHKFNSNEFLVEFNDPKCVVGINHGFLKLVGNTGIEPVASTVSR